MLGKLALRFLMLVATEGEGRDLKLVAFLKAGTTSSPSIGTLRYVNLRGFSMYLGYYSKVHDAPDLAGLDGLNAISCMYGGLGSSLGGRGLMSMQTS